MYYLRTKPAANAIQFTVDKKRLAPTVSNGNQNGSETPIRNSPNNSMNGTLNGETEFDREVRLAQMVCSLENKDECLMCGS